jgi:hypothetical protein
MNSNAFITADELAIVLTLAAELELPPVCEPVMAYAAAVDRVAGGSAVHGASTTNNLRAHRRGQRGKD